MLHDPKTEVWVHWASPTRLPPDAGAPVLWVDAPAHLDPALTADLAILGVGGSVSKPPERDWWSPAARAAVDVRIARVGAAERAVRH